MYSLLEYLTEAADDGKLRHLEHAEDRIVDGGQEGFNRAALALDATHDALLGKKTKSKITTKYDGSPSVVFGHHPKTGKFFVATKSAFAKEPKLNYTTADIAKNHPGEGLREKLRAALHHLPTVAPKHGVFQGDLMYTHGDVQKDAKAFHFKPNTITYSANKDSDEGKKIAKAKLGIVVHTHYKGSNFESMKAHFDPNLASFKNHDSVHVIDANTSLDSKHYPVDSQRKYVTHMKAAFKHAGAVGSLGQEAIDREKDNIKLHVNDTVKNNERPSVDGLKSTVRKRFAVEMDKLKTEKGRLGKKQSMNAHLANIDSHADHFKSLFAAHHEMQNAKNVLVNALSRNPKFGHSVDGKETKPEGFVVTHNGEPTKLVDRNEFSKNNFANQDKKKAKA